MTTGCRQPRVTLTAIPLTPPCVFHDRFRIQTVQGGVSGDVGVRAQVPLDADELMARRLQRELNGFRMESPRRKPAYNPAVEAAKPQWNKVCSNLQPALCTVRHHETSNPHRASCVTMRGAGFNTNGCVRRARRCSGARCGSRSAAPAGSWAR
jgi:hypothetical protein